MSDVFWASLFSFGGAVVVALVTQLLTARTTTRQTDRSERQSRQQWEWSEARRREETALDEARRQEEYRRSDARYQDGVEREEAHHRAEVERADAEREAALLAARLRECWEYALVTQVRILKCADDHIRGLPFSSVEERPTVSALRACAVALLGLTEIYPLAKSLFYSTADLEVALLAGDEAGMRAAVKVWHTKFAVLEAGIAKQSGVEVIRDGTESDDAADAAGMSSKAG